MKDTRTRTILAQERRLHPRFTAHERALVAVTGDMADLPCHLIDISEGGLAFRYLDNSPLPLHDSRMDIYLNEELKVSQLPVTVVADRYIEGDFIPKRRCCVCFSNLTPVQRTQIQSFIRCHTKSA